MNSVILAYEAVVANPALRTVVLVALYIVLAPILGGLLAGVDRIVTARMQSRKGPPLFQPFYDVFKLFEKRRIVVNGFQTFYAAGFLLFIIVTGAIFFAGGDLLLVVFALTVASVFLVLGAFSAYSPYSAIGAERELIQMMAYEPMVILSVMGMYMVTKSFSVIDIMASGDQLITWLPGVFFGFLYILTIKLRKSPFDLSTSHHGHQELVKGLTTEFSGPDLALIEIAHWYENIMLLGLVGLFFAFNIWLALAAIVVTYLIEVFIDNAYARLTWRFTVKSSWIVAVVFGVTNLIVIDYLLR